MGRLLLMTSRLFKYIITSIFLFNSTYIYAQDVIIDKETTGFIIFANDGIPVFFEDSLNNFNPENLSEKIGLSLRGMPEDVYIRIKKASKGILVNSDGSEIVYIARVKLKCNYNEDITKLGGISIFKFYYNNKLHILEYYVFLLGSCEEIQVLPMCFD